MEIGVRICRWSEDKDERRRICRPDIATQDGSPRRIGIPNEVRESDMSEINSIYNRIAKGENGPNAVEYAVLLSLIIVVCVTAAANMGRTTGSGMVDMASRVKTTR